MNDATLSAIGDQFAAASNTPKMHAFFVRFIRGGIVEQQFECMAPDPGTAIEQHMGIANGAKVSCMPLHKWHEQCAAESRARLDAQTAATPPRELSDADLAEIDSAIAQGKKSAMWGRAQREQQAWQEERRDAGYPR